MLWVLVSGQQSVQGLSGKVGWAGIQIPLSHGPPARDPEAPLEAKAPLPPQAALCGVGGRRPGWVGVNGSLKGQAPSILRMELCHLSSGTLNQLVTGGLDLAGHC